MVKSTTSSRRSVSPEHIGDGGSSKGTIGGGTETIGEGLIVHSRPPSPSTDTPGIDIVIVQGLDLIHLSATENNNDFEPSEWIQDYRDSLRLSRLTVFKYNALEVLDGNNTRTALHRKAVHLLRDLVKLREDEMTTEWSIIFVCHDIGGIIVKEALALASFEYQKWGNVFDYTRMLVFSDCPNGGSTTQDIQIKLSQLVFSSSKRASTMAPSILFSINQLAYAVQEIDGLFIDSKILFQSILITLFPGPPFLESSLGLNLEKSFFGEPYNGLNEYLGKVDIRLTLPNNQYLQLKRTLLSLSSPIEPLNTTPDILNSGLVELQTYKEWMGYRGSQVLHVYGTDGIHQAGIQIFHSLRSHERVESSHGMVLYFSFDNTDDRRSTMKDMLCTFLAQLICNAPKDLSSQIDAYFEQLDEEHGWSTLDLLQWYRAFLQHDVTGNVFCVVNHLDECSEDDQKSLLTLLSTLSESGKSAWKMAITTGKVSEPIFSLLSDWPSIDVDGIVLDDPAKELSRIDDDEGMCLLRLRPDIQFIGRSLDKEIHFASSLPPLARHIVVEQARVHKEWPQDLPIQTIMSGKHENDDSSKETPRVVEMFLDALLRRIPDQVFVQKLLTWLLYAVRPLTIWELATTMSLGSIDSEGEALIISEEFEVQSLKQKLEDWFVGIVEIKLNEVRFTDRRVRDIFMRRHQPDSPAFVWTGIQDSAQYDITKSCLEYLSLGSVQLEMERLYQGPETQPVHSDDRRSLCGYAILKWAMHYSRIQDSSASSKLLNAYLVSALSNSWIKGNWALSNPFTRSRSIPESSYSVLAGLGILGPVESNDSKEREMALVEAARYEELTSVSELLEPFDFPQSVLLDAIIAASHSGNERIMLQMLSKIPTLETSSMDDRIIYLLYRAAKLGLAEFVEQLLAKGCPPEPVGEVGIYRDKSPLIYAAWKGYTATVHAFIEHHANVEFRDKDGYTPLNLAAVSGSAATVKMLVQEGHAELESRNDGMTALYFSCHMSMHQTAAVLLELGADPDMGYSNETSYPRWSPLILAASEGYVECVRVLLEHDAEPNIPGPWGTDTPLRYAAIHGHAQICQLLVEHGADPNSPLIRPPILTEVILRYSGGSAVSTQQDMIELLIGLGADIDKEGSDGKTALITAVKNGELEIVRLLLKYNAAVNTKVFDNDDEYPGWTAMSFAADGGNVDIVRALADADADLNHKTFDRELAPLHLAISNDALRILLEYRKRIDIDQLTLSGDTPILRLQRTDVPNDNLKRLINAGASLNLQNNLGDTVLTIAAYDNNLDIACYLLKQQDIDTSIYSPSYGAALHQACRRGHTEMIELLVKNDADINQTLPIIFGTPLQTICGRWDHNGSSASMRHMEYLLSKGADINKVGRTLGTALHIACCACPPEVLSFLLSNGAKCDTEDAHSRRPIHFAAFRGIEHFKIILEAGADIKVRDGMKRTPLHWAVQRGREEVVRFILAELGKECIDEGDIDGWTPLCWAVRGTPSFTFIPDKSGSEDPDQIETIKVLLENDADKTRYGSIGDVEWRPLKIALYSGVHRDVVSLLSTPDARHKQRRSHGESWMGPDGDTRPADLKDGKICDSCLWAIHGLQYHCQVCDDYDLCHKCYARRDIIHSLDHTWREEGPEYPDASGSESGRDDSADESTEMSDSDSDSDASPHYSSDDDIGSEKRTNGVDDSGDHSDSDNS
ncbi:Zinc finger, ZZ-type [Penicillium expansum]|nr:Zinc finger, ZZ-type [Penicillium expansum]